MYSTDENIYKYFNQIIEKGTDYYISNIHAKVILLEYENIIIPLVITDKNYDDSLYVSLMSHYIYYTKEELKRYKIHFDFIFKVFEKYLKHNEINKVVYVNQWLLSTNFYPELNEKQIIEITNFLKKEYKDYAIVFKNINKHYNQELFNLLKSNKYTSIISRQIFIIDKNMHLTGKQRRKQKKDLSFLKNSNYQLQNPKSDEDFKRIEELYAQLYIEKYSKYNPQYNANFFEMVNNNDFFNLNVIKNEYAIDAMSLIFHNKKEMTVPAVGYDLSVPKEKELYRIITSTLSEEFKKKFDLFNMSAGVGEYKIQRGANPAIEYLMIYYKHLPINRRIMYKILEKIVNFAIPILCKRNLCGFINSEFSRHE